MKPGYGNRAFISGLLAGCLLLLAGCRRIAVNTAPDTPVIGGPHRGGLDTVYTFTATASDSDGDSVSLRFDWGDGDTSDWNGWVAGGETVQMSHAWQSFNTFWVRAQARDPHDSLSAWSRPSSGELLIDPVRWRYEVPDINGSWSLSLALDGTVYVGLAEGGIDALNPDGTRRWRSVVASSVSSVGPDGSIYLVDGNWVYALSPDGALEWSDSLETGPMDDMYWYHVCIGADGTVYVGYDRNLYAFRPDGVEMWRFPLLDVHYTHPAVGPDGTIYLGAGETYYAVRPDGTEKWRYPMGYPMGGQSTAVAFGPDGTIYVHVHFDSLYALNPDGTRKWAIYPGYWSGYGVAVGSDGAVYYCSGSLYANGELVVRNPDGTLRNTFAVSGGARGTPALASDGTVYVIAGEGIVCALDKAGAVRWRYNTGGHVNSDVVFGAAGTAYVRASIGRFGPDCVYAINVPTGLADAPWPMYLHDPQHTGRAR